MFEWDSDKAASNLLKHGVSFEEAANVFEDVFALTVEDSAHSDVEIRPSDDRYLQCVKIASCS